MSRVRARSPLGRLLPAMSGYPDPKLEDAERDNPMQVSKTAVSWIERMSCTT